MFNTVDGQRVLKFGGIALIMLVAFLAVQVLYTLRLTANVGEDRMSMNVITVSGKGEVFAQPDIATFSFGDTEVANTVSEAQNAATVKINKAIDLIKAAGVDEKDIKNLGYNVYPRYQPCTQFRCPTVPVIEGYEFNQTIQVKVRDTSKVGTILGQLGGIQLSNISDLNFTVDDEDKVRDEAKDLAIADAREKAEKLAESLGVRLGKIVSFGDDYGYPMPYYSEMSAKVFDGAANQSTPQVPVGESTIVSNVSITYEIK